MDLPGNVVSADWLAAHLDEVTLIDVRTAKDGRTGLEEFLRGHIPTAVWASLDDDLAAPASAPGTIGGRHPLPDPAAFAASMSALGVSDGDTIIVYDDMSGSRAARLWWMLTAVGESAAVVDGGLGSWTSGLVANASAQDRPPVPAGVFTERPWPADQVVSGDEVAERVGRTETVVLDARSADRFRGEANALDDRFGHIPDSVSAPWESNLHTDGSLLSESEQQERFKQLIGDATEVIVSCGSGVTACHNALALAELGITTKLYVGSWSEWGSDPSRPLATS